MEILCLGVIFLWAVVFGIVGVSAAFISNSSYNTAGVQYAFPKNSYDIFINADKITLYTLNTSENNSKQQFYNYDILRTAELNQEQQKKLKESFIESADFRSVSKYFEPQYGLHIENDGKLVDILISFKNSTFVIHFDGKKRVGSFTNSSKNLFKLSLEEAAQF